MRELVNPSTSSLIKPEVKIKERDKNVAKIKHQLPMAHDLITSAYSCSELSSQNNIQVSFKSIVRPKKNV